MSRLIDNSISIYEAMQNIKEGKYVMPAFQRQYVWSMEQVEKLRDSILLGQLPFLPLLLFLPSCAWLLYFMSGPKCLSGKWFLYIYHQH